ncbi:MAG: transglycosylase domain-containing protein [Candidatus Dormibacteria bacterium]
MSTPIRRRAGLGQVPPRGPRPGSSGGRLGAWRGPFGLNAFQTALAAFAILVALFIVITLLVAQSLPDPSKVAIHAGEVKILDRTGTKVVADMQGGGENRQEVKLEKIDKKLQQATVAAEDRNFYTHNGVDVGRLVKAMTIDLIRRRAVSGASTITEQLAKNELLTPKGGLPGKTITRKYKEAILATEIETRFSKDRILELYLNSIYYGHHAYGIQAAAKVYFEKDANNLTLGQASLLAGLPQAPTAYDPQLSYDAAKGRQAYVLDQMVRDGYASQADADAARHEDLRPQLKYKAENASGPAPHFAEYIRQELERQYGRDITAVGGVTITSSLDLDVQNAANAAVKGGEPKLEKFGVNNAAMLVEDPKTGDILAMVGSADFNNDKIAGQVNIAGPSTKRQPGSSFKPYVYLTGVADKKFSTLSVFHDTSDQAKSMDPKNPVHDFDNHYEGTMRLRTGLVQSRNVTAEEAMQKAGPESVVSTAHRMGIGTDIKPFLSSAIGASEVTMLDHAEAYGVLATQGTKHDPHPFLKVVDSSGADITNKHEGGQQVIDAGAAFIVNDVLKHYNDEWHLGFDRPLAAKSGTTNIQNPDGSISTGDGWLMSYNPDVVIATWGGHTSTNLAEGSGTKNFYGVDNAEAIVDPFLKSMKDRWHSDFQKPSNVTIGNCGSKDAVQVPDKYAPPGGEYILTGDSASPCPTPSPSATGTPSAGPSATPSEAAPSPVGVPTSLPSIVASPTPRPRPSPSPTPSSSPSP